VPNQSKTEAFAVWIRYRIKVYDRLGTEVASWPVSAYGKSQTTMLGGSEALQRAAVLAMRDAAALMIMQLDKSTGISLLAETPATLPEPGPLSADAGNDSGEDDTQAISLGGPEAETPAPVAEPTPVSIDVSDDPGEDDTQASSLEGSEDDAS
jgi:hypothetical protein